LSAAASAAGQYLAHTTLAAMRRGPSAGRQAGAVAGPDVHLERLSAAHDQHLRLGADDAAGWSR